MSAPHPASRIFALFSLPCALALLLVAPSRASAQQRTDSIGASAMRIQAQVQARLALLTRADVAEQLATFARNYFDALIHKGFTRDEALRIVAGTATIEALGSR
jgi:hypothetical protein